MSCNATCADSFAAAACEEDTWSDEFIDCEMDIGESTAAGKSTPSTVCDKSKYSQSRDADVSAPRLKSKFMTAKHILKQHRKKYEKKESHKKQATSMMQQVTPNLKSTTDMDTIFVRKLTAKGTVARNTNAVIPVVLWPQYEFKDQTDGCKYLMVSPCEAWLNQMLLASRATAAQQQGKSGKTKAAAATRQLQSNASKTIAVWLKESLRAAGKACSDTDTQSSVDDDDVAKKKPPTLSTFREHNVPTLECEVNGYKKLTLSNQGRVMIVALNEHGRKFIAEAIPEMISLISNASAKGGATKSSAEPGAGFSFDASTPNVHNRVVWQPECDEWKVTYKTSEKKFKQQSVCKHGESLTVPPGLPMTEFMERKASLYKKALVAWNDLDKSTRQRIPIEESPPIDDDANDDDDEDDDHHHDDVNSQIF